MLAGGMGSAMRMGLALLAACLLAALAGAPAASAAGSHSASNLSPRMGLITQGMRTQIPSDSLMRLPLP